jgi:hypothetical protein
MSLIRMTQMMEQVKPDRAGCWRDGLTIEDKDSLASGDGLEPLLSPDGVQIGWYDPITDIEYPY